MSAPVVRLHLYFATGNDRAVILRQGPAKVFRMILWHRGPDTFEDGQWLKQKVWTEWCDLSPDGRHFLYFTLNGDWAGPSEGAYTALSRPPYWTALALFPEGSTWGGGGRFLDDAHYVAIGGDDILGRAEGLVRVNRSAGGQPPRHPAHDLYDTQGGVLYRRRGLELEPIRDFTDMAFEPLRAPYEDRSGAGA